MDKHFELPSDYVRTPMDRVSAEVGDLLLAAQSEAQRRGYHAARSDLVLLIASTRHDLLGDTLRVSVNADSEAFSTAVDAESALAETPDDVPRDAIRKAIFASASALGPNDRVR